MKTVTDGAKSFLIREVDSPLQMEFPSFLSLFANLD